MAQRKKPSRRSAPLRSKLVTRTGKWKPVFLRLLAETGNATLAAEGANVERRTVYDHREKDKDFAKAWQDAVDVATDRLEGVLHHRARVGNRKLKLHEGQPVFVWVDAAGNAVEEFVYAVGPDGETVIKQRNPAAVARAPVYEYDPSDTCLIFALKALRPERYRERHHHVIEDTGPRTAAEGAAAAADLLARLRERYKGEPGGPNGGPKAP